MRFSLLPDDSAEVAVGAGRFVTQVTHRAFDLQLRSPRSLS